MPTAANTHVYTGADGSILLSPTATGRKVPPPAR